MTYPQVIEDDIKKMIEKYEKYVAKTSSKNTDYTINDVEIIYELDKFYDHSRQFYHKIASEIKDSFTLKQTVEFKSYEFYMYRTNVVNDYNQFKTYVINTLKQKNNDTLYFLAAEYNKYKQFKRMIWCYQFLIDNGNLAAAKKIADFYKLNNMPIQAEKYYAILCGLNDFNINTSTAVDPELKKSIDDVKESLVEKFSTIKHQLTELPKKIATVNETTFSEVQEHIEDYDDLVKTQSKQIEKLMTLHKSSEDMANKLHAKVTNILDQNKDMDVKNIEYKVDKISDNLEEVKSEIAKRSSEIVNKDVENKVDEINNSLEEVKSEMAKCYLEVIKKIESSAVIGEVDTILSEIDDLKISLVEIKNKPELNNSINTLINKIDNLDYELDCNCSELEHSIKNIHQLTENIPSGMDNLTKDVMDANKTLGTINVKLDNILEKNQETLDKLSNKTQTDITPKLDELSVTVVSTNNKLDTVDKKLDNFLEKHKETFDDFSEKLTDEVLGEFVQVDETLQTLTNEIKAINVDKKIDDFLEKQQEFYDSWSEKLRDDIENEFVSFDDQLDIITKSIDKLSDKLSDKSETVNLTEIHTKLDNLSTIVKSVNETHQVNYTPTLANISSDVKLCHKDMLKNIVSSGETTCSAVKDVKDLIKGIKDNVLNIEKKHEYLLVDNAVIKNEQFAITNEITKINKFLEENVTNAVKNVVNIVDKQQDQINQQQKQIDQLLELVNAKQKQIDQLVEINESLKDFAM